MRFFKVAYAIAFFLLLIGVKEAVDGIAFNINSDEILLDKFVIRIVLEFINRAGE